jgi:hypothetical protein
MARPNDHIYRLWEMSPEDFNKWRRENDLPELLVFFQKSLPHFAEWQAVHKIDDTIFLALTEPSNFFMAGTKKFLLSTTGPDEFGNERTRIYFHDRPLDANSDDEWQTKTFGRIRHTRNWELPFTPYFRWLRGTKHVKAFRVEGGSNIFYEDFQYGRIDFYNTIFSRAYLLQSQIVLKLGGIAIGGLQLDQRNLDFVDLDQLTVSGGGGSRETRIAYSSCRDLTFKNYSKPFVVLRGVRLRTRVLKTVTWRDLGSSTAACLGRYSAMQDSRDAYLSGA